MKRTGLRLSEAAAADIVEQADRYKEQSGPPLAKRWEKAVTSALLRVLENPRAGTICTSRTQNSAASGEFQSLDFASVSFFINFAEQRYSCFEFSTALVIWKDCCDERGYAS